MGNLSLLRYADYGVEACSRLPDFEIPFWTIKTLGRLRRFGNSWNYYYRDTGGRIVAAAEAGGTGSGNKMLYYITDHLDSTRLILDGSNGNIMEKMTYTPMGMKWKETGSGGPSAGPTLATNRYRYNGKEEQELAAGLPYTDYGARLFDPDHCTWLSPDPLSDKYPGVYPYAFCAGDPVNYVDPDGRDAILIVFL